jgi:DNA-binding transcriptional MerR regulator
VELLLTSLPDDLVEWRGTAAELADKCNALLPRLGLEADAGSVNERLVRYYVSEEVISPAEREGREAIFGFRQAIELLVTRYLLKDGWPLKKIAAMLRSADLASLQHLLPSDRPRTRAEEVVEKFTRGAVAEPHAADDLDAFALSMSAPPRSPPAQRSLGLTPARMAESPAPQSALAMAAELTRRKAALTDNLRALGNEEGRAERRQMVRIALTAWCEVQIDAKELEALDDEKTGILGTALTQALQEERSKTR